MGAFGHNTIGSGLQNGSIGVRTIIEFAILQTLPRYATTLVCNVVTPTEPRGPVGASSSRCACFHFTSVDFDAHKPIFNQRREVACGEA